MFVDAADTLIARASSSATASKRWTVVLILRQTLMGDRGFESFSLQQRVHELSVPERDIGLAALLAMTCLAVSA